MQQVLEVDNRNDISLIVSKPSGYSLKRMYQARKIRWQIDHQNVKPYLFETLRTFIPESTGREMGVVPNEPNELNTVYTYGVHYS